eukprot:tig00021464_g21748.t1
MQASAGTTARRSADAIRSSLARNLTAAGAVKPGHVVAVAVSGGSDSMALCLLAHKWARENRVRIRAVTVDHGLRPESSAEAARVRDWMRSRGIPHDTLTVSWPGGPPSTARMLKAAREKRYDMLRDFCLANRIRFLLTGHQIEDQAETLVLRFSRASGVDGLACMSPVTSLADSVKLLRPILDETKGDLQNVCSEGGQEWIEDPSNGNQAFYRARVRHTLSTIDSRGLADSLGRESSVQLASSSVVQQFATTAHHMQLHRDALNEKATEFLKTSCRVFPKYGYAFFNAGEEFRNLPQSVGMRVLTRVLLNIGGMQYAPDTDQVSRLLQRICDEGGLNSGTTLGGCKLQSFTKVKEAILVTREEHQPNAENPRDSAEEPTTLGKSLLWDGRWLVRISPHAKTQTPVSCGPLTIRQMSPNDWLSVKAQIPWIKGLRWLPHLARRGLPVIFEAGKIIACPPLNFYARPDLFFACNWTPRHQDAIPPECFITPTKGSPSDLAPPEDSDES